MPSNIEWTEETWNPTTGCTKVSPGCAHCYAETLTRRYAGSKGWPAEFLPWVPGNETVVLHPERLEDPLRWKTPRRVFVDSMSDLFHESIPFDYIDKVFQVMVLAEQHTFQVLTKRPPRMREYMIGAEWRINLPWHVLSREPLPSWPPKNIWLGVTVENQRWANERIPILLDTPAAVRFVSAEPLLGPVDLYTLPIRAAIDEGQTSLDWVICGGESGSRHRSFNPKWARELHSQCDETGIAFFMKQMGGIHPGSKLTDLPKDLRVREYPA